MTCSRCPKTVQTVPSRYQKPTTVIRVTVRNATEEQQVRDQHPGYVVRRQVLSSNTVILILTKP